MKKPGTLAYLVLAVALGACCNGDFIIPVNEQLDYRQTAIDVTALINDCSPNFAYSTFDGKPAGKAGSCWNNSGPLYTRWFKFKGTSTTDGTIILQVGAEYGTQRKSLLALWESDGVTEIECLSYISYQDDAATLYLYYGEFVPGQDYYFSVDVMDADSRGTFKLCLTDSD